MRRLTLAAPLTLALALPALAQTSTIPGLSDPLPPTPSYTDPNQPPLPSTLPGGGVPGSPSPIGTSPGAGAKNVTATGKVMPPTTGRGTPASQAKSSTEADMIKAQKATEERNKAWDAKMRKTMGSICVGC